MRTPTRYSDLYEKWRIASEGGDAEFEDGMPQAGYYKTRLSRGGPFVPVEIICVQITDDETGELLEPERYQALLPNGEKRDPEPIWTFLTPIKISEFHALNDLYKADPRMAATNVAVDLSKAPVRLK